MYFARHQMDQSLVRQDSDVHEVAQHLARFTRVHALESVATISALFQHLHGLVDHQFSERRAVGDLSRHAGAFSHDHLDHVADGHATRNAVWVEDNVW